MKRLLLVLVAFPSQPVLFLAVCWLDKFLQTRWPLFYVRSNVLVTEKLNKFWEFGKHVWLPKKIRAKKAARAAPVLGSGVPVAVFGKMLSLSKGASNTHRGGYTMLPHQASASMVLCFVENGSNKRRYHCSSGTVQSLHQCSGSQNPKSTRGLPVPASQLKDY